MSPRPGASVRDECGQAMVMVAIFVLGLAAVSGLVADGGLLFAQRRDLQNAADAMADVEKRVLSIRTRVQDEFLHISVSDTGTGIPAANVREIYEPFFTTKGERGTGLGLFITKQVVEEHHGSIEVETSNRGTTFSISLPL